MNARTFEGCEHPMMGLKSLFLSSVFKCMRAIGVFTSPSLLEFGFL